MAGECLEKVNVNVPGEQMLARMNDEIYVELHQYLRMVCKDVEHADNVEDYLWFFDCERKSVQRELVTIVAPVLQEFTRTYKNAHQRIRDAEWMSDINDLVQGYCTLLSENLYTSFLSTSDARVHVRKQRDAVMAMYFDTIDKYNRLTCDVLRGLVGSCLTVAQQDNNDYLSNFVATLERAVHFVPHALHVHRDAVTEDIVHYITSPTSLTSTLARYADAARQLDEYVKYEMKRYDSVLVSLNLHVQTVASAYKHVLSNRDAAVGAWLNGIDAYERVRAEHARHFDDAKWRTHLKSVFARIDNLHQKNVFQEPSSDTFYCCCGVNCPWKQYRARNSANHTQVQNIVPVDVAVDDTTPVVESAPSSTMPSAVEDTPNGYRGACVLAELGKPRPDTVATEEEQDGNEDAVASATSDDDDDKDEHVSTSVFSKHDIREALAAEFKRIHSGNVSTAVHYALKYGAVTDNTQRDTVRAKEILDVKKVVVQGPDSGWESGRNFTSVVDTGWHALVKVRVGYTYYPLFVVEQKKRANCDEVRSNLVYVHSKGGVKKLTNLKGYAELMHRKVSNKKSGSRKRSRVTEKSKSTAKRTRKSKPPSAATTREAPRPKTIETSYVQDSIESRLSVTPTEMIAPMPQISPSLRAAKNGRGVPCAIPGCSRRTSRGSCKNSNCELYGRQDVGVCKDHRMSPDSNSYPHTCSVRTKKCVFDGCFHCFLHDRDNTWYCKPCWDVVTKSISKMTRAQHVSVVTRVQSAGSVQCGNKQCLYSGKDYRNKPTKFLTTMENIVNCSACGNSASCLVCSKVRVSSGNDDDSEVEYFCSESCVAKSDNDASTHTHPSTGNKSLFSRIFETAQKCPVPAFVN